MDGVPDAPWVSRSVSPLGRPGSLRRMYPSFMPSKARLHESRRSTRVPLEVVITVEGGAESLTCEGETIVVNLQGKLIATAIALNDGMRNLDSRISNR